MAQLDPFNLRSQTLETPIAQAAPAKAAPAQAASEQGPTNFWGRIAQVGIGKVNLLNAYKTTVEHKAAIDSNNSIVTNGAKKVATGVNNAAKETANNIIQKGVVKGINKSTQGIQNAIIQGPKDVIQHANDNVIQPLVHPAKGPGVDNIMQTQAAAQAAAKSGRVSKNALKAVEQIQSPADKLNAYKIISDPKLNDDQMKQKLVPIVQKQGNETKKAIGDALQIGALVFGGGSTKELLASKEALGTGLAVNAAAGTAGNVGSQLSTKPESSGKELFKAGTLGAGFGAGTALLGALGGKVLEDAKTILGKNPGITDTLQNTATTALLQKGAKANAAKDVGKTGLTGAKNEGVKPLGETTPVSRMSDKDYSSRLGVLSKAYDKEVASLQKSTTGEAGNVTKVRADALNTKYDKLVGQLNDEYKNGTVPKVQTATPVEAKSAESTLTKPALTKSKEVVNADGTKVSGSALKSEREGVQAGLADEFKDKASYTPASYKTEADNATKLVHEEPQKALDIATGKAPGSNTLQESAVYHAVKNKAIAENDYETMQKLVASSRHTEVSEAAQKLGSESYSAHANDPIKIMQQVVKAKTDAVGQKLSGSVKSTVATEAKTAASHIKAPSKGEWKMFVESLKC